MIDLHSQILFTGNPNSDNLKRTLQIAKAASKAGFKKLIATPVFTFDEKFTSTYEMDLKKCEYINKFLRQNKVDIKIYLGNEINDSPQTVQLLRTLEIAPINNTRYVLIKFDEKDSNFYTIIDTIFKLQIAGYIPIISQLEKYDFVDDNHNNIKDLIRREILIQLDVLSITGLYGDKIKKTAKELLKNNMVHVIGTNAKSPEEYAKSSNALNKIHRIVGNATFKEITITNSECILDNEIIYPSAPKETRKFIFK